MPHEPFDYPYTRPKTPGHLQDVIDKLRRNLDVLGAFTDSLAEAIFRVGTASTTVTAFQVVRVSSADNVTPALATSQAGSDVVGMAITSGAVGVDVTYQVTGVVTYTPGGLTAGSVYYLSPSVAGAITATAPTTAGQYVVVIGKATAADKLVLQIGQGVLL